MAGKVVAYIVRGDELLVFVHEHDADPLLESGLQVPAGTMHDGEDPADAVLREAREETGLEHLRIVRYLGCDEVAWPGKEMQVRHFFHLEAEDAPDEWVHVERDGGAGAPRPFRLFWVARERASLLAAAQGVMVAGVDGRDIAARTGGEQDEIPLRRPSRDGRPLVVLMSGAPGSGKTTLANHLGDAMRMPVVSKDRVRQGTMWTLGTDDIEDAPVGPPLFFGVLESYISLGISVIGDMTLFRGLSEPDIARRLAPHADLLNVHCRSLRSLERFERRARRDPVHRARVDQLLPQVRGLQEDVFDPLDLSCPCIVVDTSDGYRPTLAEIVAAIAQSSSGRNHS